MKRPFSSPADALSGDVTEGDSSADNTLEGASFVGDLGNIDLLIKQARQAQKNAYVPYSRFAVGVALLTEGRKIITGCNVECASYPLTVCAERVAVGNWITQCGGRNKEKLALCVVIGPVVEPVTPCGACRQVLAEFNPTLKIVCVGNRGKQVTYHLSDLLPNRFELNASEPPPV